MGTPLQSNKHEAASPLGCLCLSFCWEPSAPAIQQAQTWRQTRSCCWQTWRQTRSCCWQTWKQTSCCQTCRASWGTSKQQRKIVHLDMHLESCKENLDPGPPDIT